EMRAIERKNLERALAASKPAKCCTSCTRLRRPALSRNGADRPTNRHLTCPQPHLGNSVSVYCMEYHSTLWGSFLPCVGTRIMELFFKGGCFVGWVSSARCWVKYSYKGGLTDEIAHRKALNRSRRSQDEHQSRRSVLEWNEDDCLGT